MRIPALLLLATASCQLNLKVDATAQISCATDADCPDEFACAPLVEKCFLRALREDISPRVAGVTVVDERTLDVLFDEPVEAAMAATAEAYAIVRSDSGGPLQTIALVSFDGERARLLTNEQVGGVAYELTVSEGVRDVQGNSIGERRAVFLGGGVPPDSTAPTPIAPAAASRTSLKPLLVWTPKAKAKSYQVEVATDPGFATPIAGSPFSVTAPSIELTLTEPVRHYWRVRADVTTPGESGGSSFEAMDDQIYVACPVGMTCALGAAGNRSSPVASIREALTLASALGSRRILVAGRATPYNEHQLVLLDGVDIVGGYAPDFSSRSSALFPTTIVGTAATLVLISSLERPVTLESLRFIGTATAGEEESVTLSAFEVSDLLTLRDVTLLGGTSDAASIALEVSAALPGAKGPLIDGCTIEAGVSGGTSMAVLVRRASMEIKGSTIKGGESEGTHSVAISAVDAALHVHHNPLLRAGGGASSTAVSLSGVAGAGSESHFHDNALIESGAPSGKGHSTAVEITSAAALFEDNVIRTVGGFTGSVSGQTAVSVAIDANDDASVFRRCSVSTGSFSFVDNAVYSTSVVESIGIRIQDGSTRIEDCTITAGNMTRLSGGAPDVSVAVSIQGGSAEIVGSQLTSGSPSANNGSSIAVRAQGWNGALQSNTINNGTAPFVFGVDIDACTSVQIEDNDIAVGVAVSRGVGLLLRSSHGTFAKNRISLAGTPTRSEAIAIQFDSLMTEGAVVVTNNVAQAGSASDFSSALRFDVPDNFQVTHTTPVIVTNNTLVSGSTPSLGRSAAIYLKNPTGGPEATKFPPISFTNNLFVTVASAGTRACIEGVRGVYQAARASPSSLRNNAFIDCGDALFMEPVDSAGTCAGDSTRNCHLSASAVNGAAQSMDLQRLLFSSNNGEFTNVGPVGFAHFPGAPESFALTVSSDGFIAGGGLDASQSVCGDGDDSCGGVTTDNAGTSRPPCGGRCYSLGAFTR